jgi:parallel beta-helix repeat protein
MIERRRVLTAAIALAAITGCAADSGDPNLPDGCDQLVEPGAADQTALATAFVEAEDNSTLCLAEGEFSATRQLVINTPGLVVRGAGADKTIIEFSGLDDGGGANGMLIKSDDVTLEDFQVKNTPGDGIRADQVENIAFVRVKVIWEAMHSLENGAYGLYPVQSTGVTIQESAVAGARDAGIYVGQSSQIIVEDSEAYDNVAGIEIENSVDALVRNNYAHDNTAGILVFNLPGLDVKDGRRTNVFDNEIVNNNVVNFADTGTIVGRVPEGVGVLVLAADQTEIHRNEIRDNNSLGIAVIAYADVANIFPAYDDPEYDIYSEGNWVHDNTFTNNGTMPADLVFALIEQQTVPAPDIVFDGCFDEAKPNTDGSLTNCVSGQDGANFLRANLCGQQTGTSPDLGDSACSHTPLPTEL